MLQGSTTSPTHTKILNCHAAFGNKGLLRGQLGTSPYPHLLIVFCYSAGSETILLILLASASSDHLHILFANQHILIIIGHLAVATANCAKKKANVSTLLTDSTGVSNVASYFCLTSSTSQFRPHTFHGCFAK